MTKGALLHARLDEHSQKLDGMPRVLWQHLASSAQVAFIYAASLEERIEALEADLRNLRSQLLP